MSDEKCELYEQFNEFKKEIPEEFLKESGSVFYSGLEAFSGTKELYILGLNPGGNPDKLSEYTLNKNIEFAKKNSCWSSYKDDEWSSRSDDKNKKNKAGTKGLAPRVLHVLDKLNLEPRLVPASNLIFIRTSRESHLKNKQELALKCWSFHERVIETLQPKVILCFGNYTGNFVAARLGANKEVCEPWVENNNRRWRATARRNSNGGPIVITAPHPSIAAWNVPATDPSEFIEKLLKSQ